MQVRRVAQKVGRVASYSTHSPPGELTLGGQELARTVVLQDSASRPFENADPCHTLLQRPAPTCKHTYIHTCWGQQLL